MIIEEIKNVLLDLADAEKEKVYLRFFKTNKGEYGEGDKFLGVIVPHQRLVAKEFYMKTNLDDLADLLRSDIHEHRLTALLILVLKFEKSKDTATHQTIIDFYLKNTSCINNWDLVDSSCYKILGRYCYQHNQEQILYNLAKSVDLWEKRIAIVSTLYYIKQGKLDIVPEIVLMNLNHPHDLMHKANGWMLREMGKINQTALISFLDEFTPVLPRTTLRYALEKLDTPLKQYYMAIPRA